MDKEIKNIPIDQLKFAEYNPRKAGEKEIADLRKSLQEFGFVEPIVVNSAEKRYNVIIGGHFRTRVAKEMGMTEVPVVYVNIPNIKKERELNLRLNKNLGQWDIDMLANFEEEVLKEVGWDQDELDQIFGLEKTDEFDEKKEFEKAVANPRGVKMGDLWELGEHRLVIGDATDPKSWEKVMGNDKFDFMFTDPPYRLAYAKSRVRKVKTKEGYKLKGQRTYNSVGETDKTGKPKDGFGSKKNRKYDGVEIKKGVPEFDEWLSIANQYQNPKGANVMIFESWKNTRDLWNAIEKYWKIKNMVIWHAPNRHQGFSSRDHFFNKYDIATAGGNGILNLESEAEMEEYLEEKGQMLIDNYEVSITGKIGKSEFTPGRKGQRFARVTDHVTWGTDASAPGVIFGTKPVQILVPYIKVLSPRGGIVMEPFGGSGSTMIACEIMKRRCRLIELSPMYAEVIINRFEKFTNKKPKKL